MYALRFGFLALLPLVCLRSDPPAGLPSARAVLGSLRQITVDPAQIFRVRELQLVRGDLKIYLTEGILAFATPVAGRPVAAVFTTEQSEGGDAEVLLLPPQRSERASLASFAKTPNIDEHFDSAVFFFSDDTAKEILTQISERPIRAAPELLPQLASVGSGVLRNSSDLDVQVTASILDNHLPANGFFYSRFASRRLGVFEVVHEPERFEPLSVGRIINNSEHLSQFQIWTSFRPRHSPPFAPSAPRILAYRLETTINPDLSLSSVAKFEYRSDADDGRVIPLELSARMQVTSAFVDEVPVEVLQQEYSADPHRKGSSLLLLVAGTPLPPGDRHRIEVRYQGSVIHQTGSGEYFVDERNSWYPFIDPTLATFDLTFHCPEDLRLAATGELISEDVQAGVRTIHRQTVMPQAFAGFNLGRYTVSTADAGPYRIEFFANRSSALLPDLSTQTATVLDYYSKRWLPLRLHSLAVSPIEGYFGQGFPGLIYLSNVSYVREEDRPLNLRNPRLDAFFSDLLLPHEIAHQWWGNIVTQADYRTAWLMEAMPNYSALEFLEETKGTGALSSILNSYRHDLTGKDKSLPAESAGPVDFGDRLRNNSGLSAWQLIIYEKGTWILHMLRERLGAEGFRTLQLHMLQQYASKPLANEEFRRLAAELIPAGQPDKDLKVFFEAWVYGTGVPRLKLPQGSKTLNMSGVEEDFFIDVPLNCQTPAGKLSVFWVRASEGDNPLDLPKTLKSCALPSTNEFLYAATE